LPISGALVATEDGGSMENSSKLTLGSNSIIAGVCDGLADKLTVGVIPVRVGFVLSLFLGFGLFAYLLLYMLMPRHESVGDVRRKKLNKSKISN
jgi:phage shock protein PspC (stress-responsive transcriptional regulator)